MTESIEHRGPDGTGVFTRGSVGLGNRRLAIIDLEGGKQPLSNEDESIWITFNGEIYNYRELTHQLKPLGHVFRTNSDTETIVHAYEEWGSQCVERFRGMFALAVFDGRQDKVFLARDQLGIKPLYYLQAPGFVAFASELQALKLIPDVKLHLDLQALDQYLWLQYIPAPRTIFREVLKLPPGHRLTIDLAGCVDGPDEYWRLDFQPNHALSEGDWLERLDEVLRDSVRAHLVADVPVGAFLSGGVDSSTIVAYMSQLIDEPVRTFSIGFRESDFSELKYADQASQKWNTRHSFEIVEPDAIGILPKLVQHYGEPFGDSSAIPTYYVAQLARRSVPVVLSGDGGDEAFAGYNSYCAWLAMLSGRGTSWKQALKLLAQRFMGRAGRSAATLENWLSIVNYLDSQQRSALWRSDYHSFTSRPLETFEKEFARVGDFTACSKVQYMDLKTYMPFDILTKVDVASMIHSLEVRTPLVDIRVVELAATIPDSLSIRDDGWGKWEGKRLLKLIAQRYYSGAFINRPKMGFAVPIKHWFAKQGALRLTLQERLTSRNARLHEFFEPAAIAGLLTHNLSGPLWLLLFLDEWLGQNAHVLN